MGSIPLDVIAEQIKRARAARNLTQAQLAEAAGVTDETISRIERGAYEPALSSLVAIANVLEVSLDALVGRSSDDLAKLPPVTHQPLPTRVVRLARQASRLDPTAQRTLLQLATLLPVGDDEGEVDEETRALRDDVYRVVQRELGAQAADNKTRYRADRGRQLAVTLTRTLLPVVHTEKPRRDEVRHVKSRIRQQLQLDPKLGAKRVAGVIDSLLQVAEKHRRK